MLECKSTWSYVILDCIYSIFESKQKSCHRQSRLQYCNCSSCRYLQNHTPYQVLLVMLLYIQSSNKLMPAVSGFYGVYEEDSRRWRTKVDGGNPLEFDSCLTSVTLFACLYLLTCLRHLVQFLLAGFYLCKCFCVSEFVEARDLIWK